MKPVLVEGTFRGFRPDRRFSLDEAFREYLVGQCFKAHHMTELPKPMRKLALSLAVTLATLSGRKILSFIGGGSGFGSTFENDVLKLVLQATAIANIADNAASSPITNTYAALHTADPSAGNQTTNEIGYTSYLRVAVARSSGGWSISANLASPVAAITFAAGTGGSGTATHATIGTASSSTGKILFSGTVTPNIVTGNGVTPSLPTSSTITLS
jgi:hypothetical protein